MCAVLRFVSSPKQWGYLTTTYIPRGLTTAPWTNNHLTQQHHLNNLFLVFNGRLAAPKSLAKDSRFLYGMQPFSLQHNPVHAYHRYMMDNIFNSGPALTTTRIQPLTPPAQNSIQPISFKPKLTTQVLPKVTLTVPGNNYETITTTSGSKHINNPTMAALSREEPELKLVKQTIESLKVVEGNGNGKPTSLILKPVAKAVAGAKGVAIAAPLSRAVVRKGQEVKIHFDPQAVAVVGPGGLADAHSDLLISYLEDLTTPPQTDKP